MKKILITGVSGFVGSFLAEYLLQNTAYELTGTYHSRKPILFDGKPLALEQADLIEKETVNALIQRTKPDVVFHLAALASPSESFTDPAKTITTNAVTQINLLEAIRKNNLPETRIFLISSADVYGIVDASEIPIDEETPFRPGNPYAVSKITQDYIGLQYFLAYKMDIVRLRPFNHIGPRQEPKFAIPSFAKQIVEIEKGKKEPVLFVGNLDARKDFTDVRDIVRAYAMLIEKGKVGEVYNIGSGKAYQIRELLQMLIANAKKTITIKTDPALVRPSETPLLIADTTKFNKETGWQPEITIEESLKSILDYWRSVV